MEYHNGPDEDWVEDDGGPEDDLLTCPSCHAAVHEDTQQCPHCGDWIIPIDRRHGPKRIIWALAVVLLVVALLALTIG